LTVYQMAASIDKALNVALTSGALCDNLIVRAAALNVSIMTSEAGLKTTAAICSEHTIAFSPSSPSKLYAPPTAQPTFAVGETVVLASPTKLLTMSTLVILGAIVLIGALRLISSCYLVRTAKMDKRNGGHLYDILVILNNEEEAILENISHDDIVFFRPTKVDDGRMGWTMNASPDALVRHFEVQFLDRCDLLGQSGLQDKELTSDKMKPSMSGKENKKSGMQIGIIVKVRPAQPPKKTLKKKFAGDDNDNSAHTASELDSRASTPRKVKSIPVQGTIAGSRKSSKTHVGGVNDECDDSSDGYVTAKSQPSHSSPRSFSASFSPRGRKVSPDTSVNIRDTENKSENIVPFYKGGSQSDEESADGLSEFSVSPSQDTRVTTSSGKWEKKQDLAASPKSNKSSPRDSYRSRRPPSSTPATDNELDENYDFTDA
jgi:hypothetical protein